MPGAHKCSYCSADNAERVRASKDVEMWTQKGRNEKQEEMVIRKATMSDATGR